MLNIVSKLFAYRNEIEIDSKNWVLLFYVFRLGNKCFFRHKRDQGLEKFQKHLILYINIHSKNT